MTNDKISIGTPRQDGQLSILFNKGGARNGAGKKRLGITKKTSLTLSEEIWGEIDLYCKENKTSQSEALRNIINQHFLNRKLVKGDIHNVELNP